MKCVVTGIERKATPEELVRQSIALELMQRYGYRREDLRLELPVQMGSSSDKRADIAIFRPETSFAQRTQHTAYIIVECKRADVHSAAFEVAKEQLKSYMAACNNSHFGMVVAGNRRVCYREIKHSDGRYESIEIHDIPHAMAPKSRFTVVGTSPLQPFADQHFPPPASEQQFSEPTRLAARKPFPVIALRGALAALALGGACAAAAVWMSHSVHQLTSGDRPLFATSPSNVAVDPGPSRCPISS